MYNEAYYALWAKHLAWGYFDHPPMVALWIRLSTICFGDHEFGVRALGTLSATAKLCYLTFYLGIIRQTERGDIRRSALLRNAADLSGAIIIAPDTPLVFFWSIALYALVRIFCGGVLPAGGGSSELLWASRCSQNTRPFSLARELSARWLSFPDCGTGGGTRCRGTSQAR